MWSVLFPLSRSLDSPCHLTMTCFSMSIVIRCAECSLGFLINIATHIYHFWQIYLWSPSPFVPWNSYSDTGSPALVHSLSLNFSLIFSSLFALFFGKLHLFSNLFCLLSLISRCSLSLVFCMFTFIASCNCVHAKS